MSVETSYFTAEEKNRHCTCKYFGWRAGMAFCKLKKISVPAHGPHCKDKYESNQNENSST